MHLKINLASREDIAAAVPLLQLILQGTVSGGQTRAGDEGPEERAAAASSQLMTPGQSVTLHAPNMAGHGPAAATFVPTLTDIVQQPDAAQVFGGQPAQLPAGVAPFVPPTVAPSTAGVPASPNAPAGVPGGLPIPTPGALPFVPPIVPPVLAPTAGATGGNPASGVELDSAGLPWDERIHAGTKTKKQNGEWTGRRGVNDAALVARVTAELKARVAGGAAPVVAVQPVAPVPFVPPVVASPPAQPVAPLVPAGPPETFEQFVARSTASIMAGQMPPDAPKAAVEAHKLPGVESLAQNTQYIPHVWNYLKQQYPAIQ